MIFMAGGFQRTAWSAATRAALCSVALMTDAHVENVTSPSSKKANSFNIVNTSLIDRDSGVFATIRGGVLSPG
jgi:hypothetical protein